jgi:molybdopterin-guanine dinucleotide biosynthesis protein MobB
MFGLRDYHSHQIAFCGYSGAGKTTLIEKLILKLSQYHKVGYAKHDGHHFEVDREGKDTARMSGAGAQAVAIHNATDTARMGPLSDAQLRPLIFQDCDMVLIEGHKQANFKKLVIFGEAQPSEETIREITEHGDVLATISPSVDGPLAEVPHFSRDNVEGIANFVLAQWLDPKVVAKLAGLVLAGGRSTRMKQDKSQLVYDGRTQVQRTFDTLSDVCDQVWVSGRTDQNIDLPMIEDVYLNMGPMGGILSAMDAHRDLAWLVVAVDMPFMSSEVLKGIVERRQSLKVATTYLNRDNHLPEPLCSIYEPKSKFNLMQFMGLNVRCPRKVLLNTNTEYLDCPEPKALANANTPEDYQAMIQEFQRS